MLYNAFIFAFFFSLTCKQEQVSGSTTTTVLRNLDPNTVYKVTLLPIYEKEIEGKRQSENGKTSESPWLYCHYMS